MAALLLAGCAADPSRYATALDDLGVPATWDLVGQGTTGQRLGGCLSPDAPCPRVDYYFLAPGDVAGAYAALKERLGARGWTIEEEFHPDCSGQPSGAACAVVARTDDLEIDGDVYLPGQDPGGLGVGRADRVVIRVSALPWER